MSGHGARGGETGSIWGASRAPCGSRLDRHPPGNPGRLPRARVSVVVGPRPRPDRRRVIDRLGDVNRLFDHDRGRRLHRPEPGLLGLLLAAPVFHLASLFLRSFRRFPGLPDCFLGGRRRYLHCFSLDSRRRRSGGIGHTPRAVCPFVDRCGTGRLPGETRKQQREEASWAHRSPDLERFWRCGRLSKTNSAPSSV